jgi:hypothetical protein
MSGREDRGLSGDGQRIEQLGWMLFLKIMDDKDAELELLDDDYVSPIPHEFQWRHWAKDEEGLTGEALESFIDGEKGMFIPIAIGTAGFARHGCPLEHGTGGVPGQQQLHEERHQPAPGGEQAQWD